MLASKDQYINEASNTIFQLSADDLIRKQCQDREEYYLDLQSYEQDLQDYREELAQKDIIIEKTLAETEYLRSLLKKHGISEVE